MDSDSDQLTPETTRLLKRVASALLVFAGLMALLAFGVGFIREGQVRWLLLLMAAIFLVGPLIMRRSGGSSDEFQPPRS